MCKFIFTLLLIVFFADPAAAQDVVSCDSYPDVPVNIIAVFDEPQYDFSQNLASVQAIARDRQHAIPHNEAIAMGITRYSPVLEFRIPMMVETPPDGLACARVQHVDVTVGYHDVTVFIANEIRQGTCAFAETMGHEQKHVAVNRELLQEFAPRIEERLKSYLRLYGVFRVENADFAEQLLRERLTSEMNDIIQQMQNENIQRQQLVDSRSEYERLSRVCGGDLSRIAGQFMRAGR
jgi:hypothetical protein